jgi:hypothetical protein
LTLRLERRPVESHRQHERRHVGEVIDQERGRPDHALSALVRPDGRVHREVGPSDHRELLGDRLLRRTVVDDHPAVALQVPAHRRVTGDLDAREELPVRHGTREVEPPAHLLRRRQQPFDLVEVEAGAVVPGRHDVTGASHSTQRTSPGVSPSTKRVSQSRKETPSTSSV